MAGLPVVTITGMHMCPMTTGLVPHVGGPVVGPGCPGIMVNGLPVSVMGDMCTCCGPVDTVVQGCPGVTANGTPIVLQTYMTAHGGVVVQGVPGVTVGSAAASKATFLPVREIPFPKITVGDKVGAFIKGKSSELKQAKEAIEQMKEEAEKNGFLPDFDFSI